MYVAKQEGKLPAFFDKAIENILDPKISWKNALRRFMTEKSNDNFTWARGNRRFVTQGLYLPSRVDEGAMGETVIVIDTSGSITQKELDIFAAEIKGILNETRPIKTHVIYCDMAVNHIDTYGPHDDIVFTMRGGGGTDFRPPFIWAQNAGIYPKALVYLTDGYGTFPEDPGYPTMWTITNNIVIPPFGEHLVLEA